MSTTVDARGLSCPQPVILTRDAMSADTQVTTIVDNETAQHNVTRMAERAGWSVRAESREDGIYLHIVTGEVSEVVPITSQVDRPLVLVVPAAVMGRGEHIELGQKLIQNFFYVLEALDQQPDTIIFFNSGVKLVAEGSPALEHLQALQGRGVEILACGTCLNDYGLAERVAVGKVSNMYTIAAKMMGAGRVVSL